MTGPTKFRMINQIYRELDEASKNNDMLAYSILALAAMAERHPDETDLPFVAGIILAQWTKERLPK